MNVPVERVREQIVSIFTAWGMDAELVKTAAQVMVETDLAGVDSHGVSMLMDYDQYRRRGKLNLKAKPRVVREGPATALIDADAGLGHPAAVMGMALAIAKSAADAGGRRHGVQLAPLRRRRLLRGERCRCSAPTRSPLPRRQSATRRSFSTWRLPPPPTTRSRCTA